MAAPLALLAAAGCGGQADFPARPLTIICPWSAGGGTDRVSRQLAMQLERRLGVPVNVINATGGSGVTGFTRGARARPDGTTLLMMTVELSMLHWRGLTDVTHADFTPLCLLNRDAAALFVRAAAASETLADLEQAIQRDPGRLQASGTAQGGIWHAALAGWLDSRGLPSDAVTWVSLNGSGPSLQELLAGGIDLVCCSVAEAEPLLVAGRVRCLGVMSPERLSTAPEIPTFREQGSDWEMAGWRGLGVPIGTPQDHVDVLVEAVTQEATSEEFRMFLANAGFDHSYQPPDRFADTLVEQDAIFGRVMAAEAFGQVAADAAGRFVFPALAAGLLGTAMATSLLTRPRSAQEVSLGETTQPILRSGLVNALLVVVAVGLFIAVVEPVGFLVAAAAVVTLLAIRFGTRVGVAVLVGLLTAVAVQAVFGSLLRVPLPRGLWLDG